MLDVVVISVRTGEADVLAHRVGEQERFLEHERDGSADVGQSQLAQVVSVEEDAPTIRVVEAGEKPCNRALSRSGCTDERERLAGSDFQVETIEDRCIAPPRVALVQVGAHRVLLSGDRFHRLA